MREISATLPLLIGIATVAMTVGSAAAATAPSRDLRPTSPDAPSERTVVASFSTVSVASAIEAFAPAAPTGLEARVYSRTAGEIFWERPATFGLVHDVSRDGDRLVTTDGTSHFDDTLAEGRTYTYAIVAIDREGRRSAPASITLTTRGDTVAGAPAAPTGLEARVYSRTAGEIFWERPATFGLVHDVSRDGERLVTTDGTSHFDDTLAEGRTYTYAIVAIDREGRRSAPARITLTTRGDAAPASMVSRDSYEALLAHAFELYDGGRYNAPLLPMIAGFDQVLSIAPSYGPTREDDGTVRARYDCESGRAELELTPTGTNAGEFFLFRFEQCLDQGLLLDGTIDANQNTEAPSVSSEGLVLTREPDRELLFSGYARRRSTAGRSFPNPTWETIALNLVGHDDDGAFALEDSTTRFGFAFLPNNTDIASLSGSLSIRSEASGGRKLFASIPLDFSYEWNYLEPPETSAGQVPREDPSAPWSWSDPSVAERRDDWYFGSGQLELVGEDGSRVLLDADTGDAATVRITIDDAAGSDTFETPWTPWQRLLRLGRDADDPRSNALAAPTGLEARVYSRTAGEIFWERPATFGLIHDVLRDGERLATTDGTSYFDDALESGRRYTYAVVAIDRQGRRSAASEVSLSTRGGEILPDGYTITRANHERLVAEVLAVFAGRGYGTPLLALADDELLGDDSAESYYDETPVHYLRFVCEEGDAALERRLGGAFGDGGIFADLAWRFDACLDRGILRSGSVEAYDGRYGKTVRSAALRQSTGSATASTFSGFVGLQREAPQAGRRLVWETRDVAFGVPGPDGVFAVHGLASRFVAEDASGLPTLTGGFVFRSATSGGRDVVVTIKQTFLYRERDGEYFEEGQLELRAEDGSVLLLDAATGTPDTVHVGLDNPAESERFVRSWAPWRETLRLDHLSPDGS